MEGIGRGGRIAARGDKGDRPLTRNTGPTESTDTDGRIFCEDRMKG